MPKIKNERLNKVRKAMVKAELPALLVTNLVNRNYVSGFTGTDCILLITSNKALFITDFRYTQQAIKQVHGFQIFERSTNKSALQIAIEWAHDLKVKKLGFESEHLSYHEFQEIKKWGKEINFTPTQNIIEYIRVIKDDKELKEIVKSQNISMQAFEYAVSKIKPGVKEKEIAWLYEQKARQLGASSIAFHTIVASGWRSALPHGVASDKKIKKGELLVFDFGVIYNNYNSDCTRTFIIGKSKPEQREIYDVVLNAQKAALESIRPGITGKELDSIARTIISKHGFGDYFGHGLGHGVGMEIHEAPRLSQTSNTKLEPGMVVTVEPGIYIEEIGGVRIEDLVVVTEKGYRVLTPYPKALISLKS